MSTKKISATNTGKILSKRSRVLKKTKRSKNVSKTENVSADEWTSKQKTAFRSRKEWTEFRKNFLKENPVCIICGVKSATVHHKYKKEYNLLDKSRFLAMCRTCHRFAHRYAQLHNRTAYTYSIKNMLHSIDFGDDWINS